MPDYLCCGSCHNEFELSNFNEFIQHKAYGCNINNNGSPMSTEFLLECIKCLQKFKTPWKLLLHVQDVHHNTLMRALAVPQSQSNGIIARPRHTQQDSNDTFTQTSRSCLKRLVCPYEENLPEECCIKASKKQRELDKGCCCIDSMSSTKKSIDQKKVPDCCLIAVPKKRRLLEADLDKDVECCQQTTTDDVVPPCCKEVSKSNQIQVYQCCKEVKTTVKIASSECSIVNKSENVECPCEPNKTKRKTNTTESQTDFLDNFDFDMDMLLGENDLENLVNNNESWSQDGQITTIHTNTGSIQTPVVHVQAATKAIQTYSRVQEDSSSTYFLNQLQQIGPPQMEVSNVANSPTTSSSSKGNKMYQCTQCGKSFRQNVHLRKHIMTEHTKNKPYKCTYCDYTTVEKSHLTVHIRKHTGERPFHCRECDYSTAQNCTLKAHYLRKHPNSRIICDQCGIVTLVTDQEMEKHKRSCNSNMVIIDNNSITVDTHY